MTPNYITFSSNLMLSSINKLNDFYTYESWLCELLYCNKICGNMESLYNFRVKFLVDK